MQSAAPWPSLVNGAFSETLNVADRGLQFGDGLFETMFLQCGKLQLLELHMERLLEGAQRLRIALYRDRIEHDLQHYLQHCETPGAAALKLIVTRGESSRGYRSPKDAHATLVVRMYEHQELSEEQQTQGVTLRICQMPLAHSPALAGIKHLNRLEQVLARAEWHDDHIFEGLMLDVDGHIVAGTMSNIFLCKDNVILTSPLDQCGINGVIRRCIIERLAPKLDIRVRQQALSRDTLAQADEVFISNSLMHIVPVSACEQLRFRLGPVTIALQSALHESLSH